MPNIKVDSGQIITLTLKVDTPYNFLCENIGDHVVFSFFSIEKRHLVIANFPSDSYGDVVNLMIYGGVAPDLDPASYEAYLVCGPKAGKDIIEKFEDCFGAINLKFELLQNHQILCIECSSKGEFLYRNVVPKLDFLNVTDERVTNLLEKWATVDTLKQQMLQTFVQPGIDEKDMDESPNSEAPHTEDSLSEMLDNFEILDDLVSELNKKSEINEKTKSRLARLTMKMSLPDIYEVGLWQTAIMSMASGRLIKITVKNEQCALVLFDHESKMVAVSVLGKEATKALIELTIKRCIGSLLTLVRKSQADKKGQEDEKISLNLVYQFIAPSSCPQGTIMRQQFSPIFDTLKEKFKAEKSVTTKKLLGNQIEIAEGKFGISPQSPLYCPYTISFLEISKDKFNIVDFTERKGFKPEYQSTALLCTAKRFTEIKELDRWHPDRMKYKGFYSVVDTPLVYEIIPSLLVEVDLLKDKCFLELKDKTIVMASYCEHTGKFAVLQIATDDFKTYLLNEEMTAGNFTVLSFMAKSPEKAGAPPTKLFLWCKKPKAMHGSDNKLCETYIKNFDQYDKIFDERIAPVFDKRTGTQYRLHPLKLSPDMQRYDEKQVGAFLCISLQGTKLNLAIKKKSELNFNDDPVILKPEPENASTFYKALGLNVMSTFKLSHPFDQSSSDVKPKALKTTASQATPGPKTPPSMGRPK